MKITNLKLNNFAAYDNVSVSFDPNITYLIGKNGSGKSTLGISAIQAALQGIAEKSSGGNQPLIGERFRFVGNNGRSANIELSLFDDKLQSEIKVIRKITASGQTLAFEAPEGLQLDQKWLNDLFNIFMIAPKKFTELSGKEQAVALGIDTSEIDSQIAALKSEYTLINRDLKAFDNLQEVEKAEKVDISALQNNKEVVREILNRQYIENKEYNKDLEAKRGAECDKIDKEVAEWNKNNADARLKYNACYDALCVLVNYGYDGNAINFVESIKSEIKEDKAAADYYPLPILTLEELANGKVPLSGQFVFKKELPDNSELLKIDEDINNAVLINERALLYSQYLEKLEAKQAKQKELDENKLAQQQKIQERLDKIKSYKFPFDNLSVNDSGELELNKKPIKPPYFSTGQLLKIVPKLIATTNHELKYIFLQDFNLMDEELQSEVEADLTGQGYQLVIEYVGKSDIVGKNCILLKDCNVVDNLEDDNKNNIL